jgi:hypothetical protein
MECKTFYDFILNRVEHFDQKILDEMHPMDSQWVGTISTGSFQPQWWECRESVRKISEGDSYMRSEEVDGIGHTFDRFASVYPDIGTWKPYEPHDWVKLPV